MKRFLFYMVLGMTSLGIMAACGVISIYIWATKDLESITKVDDYRMPLVTTVYARDNSIMGYFFNEKRFLVNIEDMPKNLTNAFFAAEDADFFAHHGVNFKAILRAFIQNLRSDSSVSGGSTITQQLVKRIIVGNEKSYKRKIREAELAYRLEKHLDKQQILYLYLNQIYLGNSSYGVEAAARTYFAKHVQDLTLAECAVIAGLPKAPSRNNPYRNAENIQARQHWVLKRMLINNFINEEEYQQALEEPLHYSSMPDPSWKLGAWYLEEVRRQAIAVLDKDNMQNRLNRYFDSYGEEAFYNSGLNIYTAMDPIHQAAAEKTLRNGLYQNYKNSGWHGPIDHLSQESIDSFLSATTFLPKSLDNAGWVKAVVDEVTPDGATVLLGNNGKAKGYISIKTMSWCRTPNLRVLSQWVTVKDATKVLAHGDLIWVSAVGAQGNANPIGAPANLENKKRPIPVYNSSKVEEDTLIELALEQPPVLQGAMTSIDVETGDLLALVGGYDSPPYSMFNRAIQAKRQPGSSFKPFVYSTAIDNGFTSASVLMNTPFSQIDPYTGKEWRPKNFDGKFSGPELLRNALARSLNVCTVKVARQIGMRKVIERAKQLGIEGNIPAVLAISLGSWEVSPLGMAEAYTAFANKGVYIKPRVIRTIANRWNEPIIEYQAFKRQAISPQNAFIMASLLKDTIRAGTGSRAKVLGRPVAGKTGTTNEERDAWFIGFSPYIVTSIYVGYDDHRPMGRQGTGSSSALPIFVEYRKEIDSLYPATDFEVPSGVTVKTVNTSDGKSYTLPFLIGTEPHGTIMMSSPLSSEDIENAEDLIRDGF